MFFVPKDCCHNFTGRYCLLQRFGLWLLFLMLFRFRREMMSPGFIFSANWIQNSSPSFSKQRRNSLTRSLHFFWWSAMIRIPDTHLVETYRYFGISNKILYVEFLLYTSLSFLAGSLIVVLQSLNISSFTFKSALLLVVNVFVVRKKFSTTHLSVFHFYSYTSLKWQ